MIVMMAGGRTGAGVQFLPHPTQVASTGQPCPQIHPHWSPGLPAPPASMPCACLSPAWLLVHFRLTPLSASRGRTAELA